MSLDISPLFFHIVSKLVQALFITYDEIFQALAAERDVLLPKPFLYLTPPPYGPHSAPLDYRVFGKLKLKLKKKKKTRKPAISN
jgi:hypothetical protein